MERLRQYMEPRKAPKASIRVFILFIVLFFVNHVSPGIFKLMKGDFSVISKELPPVEYFLSGVPNWLYASVSNEIINIAVIECPGGTDKGPDGHRKDSKYLVEGLGVHGANANLFQYTDSTADEVFKQILSSHKAHAYVSRVDPGEYEECSEEKYFEFLEKLIAAGILPFNSPTDMINLGSKKSLLNLAGMYYFPNSTYVYSSLDQFDVFFPQTLKLHGSRVIKQNRGSKGEGVWWVSLIQPQNDMPSLSSIFSHESYVWKWLNWSEDRDDSQPRTPASDFDSHVLPEISVVNSDEAECLDSNQCVEKEADGDVFDEMETLTVKLVEASDNHQEEMSLKKFRDTIVRGYLNSSDDFVVDMEYLPRIAEGEVRLILSGKEVLFVVNKQPQTTDGAFSANLGAGATHNWESPENWSFLVDPFLANMEKMLGRMNVGQAPILWTVDFIRYGEADEFSKKDEHQVHFVISEINASCVGFSANPEMGEVIAKILLHSVMEILGR